MNPERSQSDIAARVLNGSNRGKLLSQVGLIALLVISIIFGFWAFSGRQSYKNQSDKKVAAAVAQAKTDEDTQLNQQFSDKLKQPYKTYTGSPTYGSISFNYPQTYSVYVDDSNSGEPLNGYFFPGVVPSVQGNTAFALRMELLDQPYSSVVSQYNSNITSGVLKATAYIPPKMEGVKNVQAGVKLDGQIGQDQQGQPQTGSIVIISVRDKTLKLYTQSSNFVGDFNDVVLKNLTFVP